MVPTLGQPGRGGGEGADGGTILTGNLHPLLSLKVAELTVASVSSDQRMKLGPVFCSPGIPIVTWGV
jgi:hypothetical protein